MIMMMMVLIEKDRLVPSQRAETDCLIDHFPGRAFPARNRRRIPSVNTGALHRVYRLAAIFREVDYSGQILNAERKCLPKVSCSETNMCEIRRFRRLLVGNSTAGSVAYENS